MTAPGYTPTLLAAELKALRAQDPAHRVWGFFQPGPWSGGATIAVDDQTWPVCVCRSPLAVCEVLAEPPAGPGVVLLSAVDLQALPGDVRARLARRRLHRPSPWDALLAAFKATRVAPMLRAQEWLAEALLAEAPPQGFPPAPAELIDPDTAWEQLLTRRFGLADGRPDVVAWLVAGAEPAIAARFGHVDLALRNGLLARAQACGGPLGASLAEGLFTGAGVRLLAGGLLAEIIYDEAVQDARPIIRATVQLEGVTGVGKLTPARGHSWFEAARAALAKLAAPARQAALAAAESLLAEHDLVGYAEASSQLPSGLRARIARLALALSEVAGGRGSVADLEAALEHVAGHALATAQPERLERLRMAVRLARWLRTAASSEAVSLGEALGRYEAEGGWVDWARRLLAEGEPQPELADALERLLVAARARREAENRRFGTLLAGWNAQPAAGAAVLPIERVLDEVVTPWAARQPVLLLVMDGMGMAVFEELAGSIVAAGWGLLRPTTTRPVLSMLPSVTEFARTSLLSGRPARGNQADEKRAFAVHPGLRPSSALPAPALFHKGELSEGGHGQLAPAVREAIGNARIKVVGVVVNAVDDHLAKTEQVLATWRVDTIKPLAALLWEAHLARRVVIVTSDHGHIPEAGTAIAPGGVNDRWRAADGPAPVEGEGRFEGPRVEAVSGNRAVVLPWSETVRYTAKKNGYHGGASPAEMTVPLGVFLPLERLASEADALAELGWTPSPSREPAWWHPAICQPTPRAEAAHEAVPATPALGPLFAAVEVPKPVARPADWLEALLASEVFGVQRTHAGPRAPDEETVRRALALLEANAGVVPTRALAAALGVPDLRLRGVLSVLQRMLNLDGYPVLAIDDTAQEVKLDRELLRRQFQLP